MSNPVPGLCPCCKNPTNSGFLQSIHSDILFKILEELGEFGRHYLFCIDCIGWAKAEMMKLRAQLQPADTSEQQPLSSQQTDTTSQQPCAVQQPSMAFVETPIHAQYSPISETGGNRNTPDPFNMPLPLMTDLIGARLANPNDSPIHFNNPFMQYFLPGKTPSRIGELPPMLSAPLPSPVGENDLWNMDDDEKSKKEPHERADPPE